MEIVAFAVNRHTFLDRGLYNGDRNGEGTAFSRM
jgi:hypothetical protein